MNKENNSNHSIHCTVHGCKYHNGTENYCSLSAIQVATDEKDPKTEKCVDCKSFEHKSNDPMF